MELIANSVLNLLSEHRYIFAFLGALFEGAYIMILAGVLFKFGYFNFWGLITVLISGYFIQGFGLYLIGRIFGHEILKKWGKKLRITRGLLEKFENYFIKHSVKTLFITRITYGLSWVALIIAGSLKMKLKKILVINLITALIWIAVMFGIGYVFGLSYEAIESVTERIAKGLATALLIIIILISVLIIFLLRRIIKNRFVKKLDNNRFSFFRKIGQAINNLINNKHENK